MNFRKIWIYINSDGHICTVANPYIQKRNGERRYDIFSSYYNPVTGEYESVKVYEFSPKIRSMKAAEKAARDAIKKMAGMLVWFTATKDWAEKIAAKNCIRLIWRAA